MAQRLPMPKPIKIRCGCKVAWNYYEDEGTARVAGKIAAHNAEIDEAEGYDFGMQSPGVVTQVTDPTNEFFGMYEVCIS